MENGAVFKAASSETGNYTVSQLPVGDYDITVIVAGFKKYSHTKFHLDADQIACAKISRCKWASPRIP